MELPLALQNQPDRGCDIPDGGTPLRSFSRSRKMQFTKNRMSFMAAMAAVAGYIGSGVAPLSPEIRAIPDPAPRRNSNSAYRAWRKKRLAMRKQSQGR